ncbi:Ig-like domain-containing protein [Stenotrophomonas sp. Iso1]|uniref:Ig-like domain-containing protein n=1 Tax=Stenotrophomonas sp. Iso1 TaxID=2977283 RepID=UPI0022B76FF5|nr:Ig-like domain-containing protein [Stenotrophomonas sp. Iso1]
MTVILPVITGNSTATIERPTTGKLFGGATAAINSVPAIETVLDDKGAKQGAIENGGHTDDSRPEITGKAAEGVVVHLYDDSELIGRVTVGASGEWSFIPRLPLADGRHEISVIYEYPDGDVSDVSAPYEIFVDKVAPDTPIILGIVDDEGRLTGAIASEGVTDDNRPTVDGTTEANATVIVYDKGKEIGRAQADEAGKWSFTPEPPLADGTHILEYVAVDQAGNQSEKSGSFEFLVDTRPELVNIHVADDDVGSITGTLVSGSSTDDELPTLRGTATAGGVVSIYEGSVLLGQTTAGVDGRWTFTPTTPLSEGPHALQATVTLVAKGESERSPDFNLVIDLSVPDAPHIVEVIDNVGSQQGLLTNGAATDDDMPLLVGKAEAGSTVHIYDNGSVLGSTVADANGNWSYTPLAPLSDGEHAFTAVAEDKAGNASAPSSVYEVVVDTTAPGKPIIVSVYDDAGLTTGEIVDGATTDDSKPTISGTAEPNSTVVINDNGTEIGRALADGDGKWSFEPSQPLAWGGHALTAEAIDAVGNISAPSETFNLTLENNGDDYIDLSKDVSPVSVTFVADVSGSMAGERMVQLRASLTAMVNEYAALGKPATFSLITFNSAARNVGTFDFSSTADPGYANLIVAIAGLVETGTTNMSAGMAMAISQIKAEYAAAGHDPYVSKQVYLLSDGAPDAVPNFNTWHAAMQDPDGNPATNNPIEVTTIGLGEGASYVHLDKISSSGSSIHSPVPEDLHGALLQNMLVSLAEGNLLENDVQIEMDGGSRLSQIVVGNEVFKITAMNQLEVSNASGKATATYDPATGLLTLKTDAGVLAVYMKSSAGHDAGDYSFRGYNNMKLHLEESVDYVYDYTAVNSKGETQVSSLHVLGKVPTIGPDSVSVTSIGKDGGVAGDYLTGDADGGRLVTGTLKADLADGLALQVSMDGGVTWHSVTLVGRQWAFVDMQAHQSDWTIQTRVADTSGNNSGAHIAQNVTLETAYGAPTILRIPEAEGIYTAALAAGGSQVILSLSDTGAKAGDIVHMQWGSTTYDQVLTQLDINTGLATINVPATATVTAQGTTKDFAVTAQIHGQGGGAVGVLSKPYQVVGVPVKANVADTLQKVPVDDEYAGTGFKVTTTGSLTKTALTPAALSGLTLGGTTQVDATFTLDKPASYFTLRLTGIDNSMGAQIQVFDMKGNLMYTENFVGGTDARHTKTFTYTAPELTDIGSFKVVTAGAGITLDAFSQTTVTHTTETRDPNLINYLSDSFLGTAGNDFVTLRDSSASYFGRASTGIHGGAGIDTLKLDGTAHDLNLATIGNKLSSIEILDLVSYNTLTLGLSNVLDNGAVNAFYIGDKDRVQMMVKGNGSSKMNLSDLLANGNDFGDWVKTAAVTVDGVTYDSYQHSSLGAELLVQVGVTVTVTNSTLVGVDSAFGAEQVESAALPVDSAMLTLNLSQVLNDGGMNLFYDGDQSRAQMMVKGNAGDSINLDDLLDDGLTDLGDWAVAGSHAIDGVAYTVYQHSGANVELLVQEQVTVNLI